MVSINQLQGVLPAFDGIETIITQDQDVYDIIAEVGEAHKLYCADYDSISSLFAGPRLYENLFDFCTSKLIYVAEPTRRQTSRSPAAILAMSPVTGVDCKHYAGWIAGVLDSLNRNGRPINWYYRFASYDPYDDEPVHVFVVVKEGGKEIWIDPTPMIDPDSDYRVERFFNDRLIIPEPSFIDKKIRTMALSRIHGMNPNQGREHNIGANYIVDGEGCLGRAQLGGTIDDLTGDPSSGGDPFGLNTPPTGTGGGGGANPPPTGGGIPSPNGGTPTANGLDPAKVAALNAALPGAGDAVNQVLNMIPAGDLKDFLTAFINNPQKEIMTLIKGRTYTSGDYKLAEVYMRNILGLSQVQRWEQVPDTYVPQAWLFFTVALGVRMRTYDDMEQLAAFAYTPTDRANDYLKRNPPETSDISLTAAIRAATLIGDPNGGGGLFNIYDHRDVKWPLTTFAPITPWIYPIPSVEIGTRFTGVNPINGMKIIDGYPADWTGPRYTTQLQTTVLPPPAGLPVPAGTGLPGTPTQQAGFGNVAGWVLVALAAGTVIYGVSHEGKKKGTVNGPGKKNLTPYIIAGAVAAGIGGYLLYQNYSVSGKKSQLIAYINSSTADSPASKILLTNVFNTMTDDEISATYTFIFSYVIPGKQLTDAVDAPLRAQIIAISAKYKIFS